MTTRDAYVKRLKHQLDQWNAEISMLEAKAKHSVASVRDSYERRIKELRERRSEMHQKMTEIQKAGDRAWDHLREGADKMWEAMEEGFKKAWSVFK